MSFGLYMIIATGITIYLSSDLMKQKGIIDMFYMFKIMKSGLKFIDKVKTQDNRKNILYLTEDEIEKISPEVITNFKDMKGIV